MWLQTILSFFKIRDLRNKVLFVLGVFVFFRVLANIPVPGINHEQLAQFFASNQLLGILSAFTGGAMDNLSIAMLGLGPYITATIVLQLLTMIFPALNQMYKEEGDAGRQKFNQYGRMLTVPLAFIQGYGLLTLLSRSQAIGHLSLPVMIVALLTITAGSLLLVWMGELISEKGIGNGVSLLIFAGIVARFPNNIRELFAAGWDPSKIPSYAGFFIMSLIIIMGVVFITQATRNIPVSYTKRVRGNKMYGGVSTYLPLNVNPAGVIPIIFALSILTLPGMIAGFLAKAGGFIGIAASWVTHFLNPSSWGYNAVYFILISVFTYFYTAVTFDPKAISENLQKSGGFILGVRPGPSTAQFIHYILNRILLVGAMFLGVIAILPSLIQSFSGITEFRFLVGGTSLLIVVSVVLETMKQIHSQLQMRDYDSF